MISKVFGECWACKLTEKWYARWICFVQCVTVVCKVLGTSHELSQTFEDGACLLVNLIPGPVKTVYRCSPQSRDDGSQCGEIV